MTVAQADSVEFKDGSYELRDDKGRTVLRAQFAAVGGQFLPSRSSRVARIGGKDATGTLDVESRIVAAKDGTHFIVDTVVHNNTQKDVVLPSMDVLREGSLAMKVSKALTNGYIYYDSGHLVDLNAKRAIDSFWNAAFYSSESKRAIVIGFIDGGEVEGHVIANPRSGECEIIARANLHPGFALRPGESVSCGKLAIIYGDPFESLETYATLCAKRHPAKLNPVINGWCSWFVYYGGVSEAEVLKNAEFIARELKPYGMEWIQIDDGYYRAFGEWEGNDRFPHGMKHTADEIRKLGLKPGIWIAPYCISKNTTIAKDHPDWLVHDASGKIQEIEPAHQQQAQYILDVTHPEARAWLANLLKTITNEWGYDFVKTDFVEWTLLAAQKFHDPTLTKAQAYRMGDQTMRDAMGPSRHFLDCGPGNEVVGLIDSMRIGLDRPVPENPLWHQYAGFPNSTIPSVAKRYFFHNRTWINDPDHLRTNGLTIPQAQAAATIVALSGGTMISGDKLYELDRERLDIIKKVLPSYGQSARPIDLFENPLVELFALPIKTSFGEWMVVGDFNTTDKPVDRDLDFSRVGLEGGKKYLIYDFWSQEFLGEHIGRVRLNLDPTSVKLLSVRESSGVPQLVGTNRHVTQGAIEFKDIRWNDASNTLVGDVLGKRGMKWKFTVYLPPGYELAEGPKLADMKMSDRLIEGWISFETGDELRWSLKFKKT